MFLAAADRKLNDLHLGSAFPHFCLNCRLCSGDDFPCLRNVESITDNINCPSAHLCPGSHPYIYHYGYLPQSRYAFLWYVLYETQIIRMISHISTFLVTLTQVRNSSACKYFIDTGSYREIYPIIPRQVLALLLLLLAATRTLGEAFHMYQATRRWQPNRYMALIARDGILYFFL